MEQACLAEYVTRNIQNPMSRIKGVGKFQLFASPRAMRVWVDPAKLVGYGMSMSDVSAALAGQNMVISGGILGSPPNPGTQRTSAPVIVSGELTTVEAFENAVLRANPDGSIVRVKDDGAIDRKSTRLNSSH